MTTRDRVRVGPDIIGENGGFAGDNSDTALEEPIGFLKEIRYTKLLRSQRDGTWVITRDKNDWSCIPFRSNPFRDIESATVRQFVVHHVDIKRFLFDGCESVGNRLTCLDLVLLIGKHPVKDPTDCNVVGYH